MKSIIIEELPLEYKELYANKIYTDIIQEKIKYCDDTINGIIAYFIEKEEYEKCEKIKLSK